MHLAGALAAQPVSLHSPRPPTEAARSQAVADASGVAGATAVATGLAAGTQRDATERPPARAPSGADVAALQAELGLLRAAAPEDEDLGIPGDVTPPELVEDLDVVADGHEARADARADERASADLVGRHRDLADAVADAVVTVDEYVDWVLAAGIARD